MNFAERDLRYIWHPCSQMKDYEDFKPIVIDHGKGMYLYDVEGNEYMDVISSWWCNLLGHCHPRINAALKKQIDLLEHVIFANFSHRPAIELCERLAPLLPKGLEKFFFADNGSAAIEVALKMNFQYHCQQGEPQRKKFMALTDAYHGETLGALSVGAVDLYSKVYKPLLLDVIRPEGPDCYRCKFGKTFGKCSAECFSAVEKALAEHGKETAAFIVEPLVQAAAGMKIYPPLYLKKLSESCTKYGVHLILDEIATGYGRTGKMFACEYASISPDMMCISKGLTGGYMPMAITVTTEKIYNAFYSDYREGKAFMHSHTYCGNPLACSAALEVLKILEEEKILEKARDKAEFFSNLVAETFDKHPHVGGHRFIGLINAVELVKDKENKIPYDFRLRLGYQVYREAVKKGILLRPMGDVLYFNPPLIIEPEQMKRAVEVCRECIDIVLERNKEFIL